MHIRQGEKDFFQILVEVAIENLLGFLFHLVLIAAGAWIAFYFMKHYELEESD